MSYFFNYRQQEYQSFTDLQFSKEKSITSIQWHPTIKGKPPLRKLLIPDGRSYDCKSLMKRMSIIYISRIFL